MDRNEGSGNRRWKKEIGSDSILGNSLRMGIIRWKMSEVMKIGIHRRNGRRAPENDGGQVEREAGNKELKKGGSWKKRTE